MRIRDRVVLGVLVGSVLLGLIVLRPIGAWASLVIVVIGVLVGACVYRLKPPAFGLHDDAPRWIRPDETRGEGPDDRTDGSVEPTDPTARRPNGSA